VDRLDGLIRVMEAVVKDLRRIHERETDPNREKPHIGDGDKTIGQRH
jgi:hypothetical protein